MSKLDELIKNYCPEGVEYLLLGDVCEISKGIQFNKSNMKDKGTYPVINGGINPSGYIEQYNQKKDTITISQGGASAGYVNWLEVDFWAGAHCYVVKPSDLVLNRYAFHFIKSQEKKLQECQYGAGIPALAKSTVAGLSIPVPPLEVQREIVRILDNFTELTAELTAELTTRKAQYEYYRDKLLSFDATEGVARRVRLGEIATVFRGEYITKKDSATGNIPVILGGQEPAYYIDKANHIGEVVVVARSGASAGFVSYWNEPIFITDGFGYEAKREIATPKYLYYTLKSREKALNGMKRGAGVPHVSGEMLSQVELPIPSLAIQERIVRVLDNFDAICSDLNIGLPAEIEARQKQYEYYRDMLLTFAETGAIISSETGDRRPETGDRRPETGYNILKLLQYVFGYAPVALADLFNTRNGYTPSKSNAAFWEGDTCISWFRMEDIRDNGRILFDATQHVTPEAVKGSPFPEDSIIISTSATIGEHAWIKVPSLANQRFTYLMVKPEFKKLVNMKYIFYYCFKLGEYCRDHLNKGNFASVDMTKFNDFVFMIPTLDKQNEIAEQLERFDRLVNDIAEGLPAEIQARQKQYEYYRDKLLSFNIIRQ